MISSDTSCIFVDVFEGRASCDCILLADGATHRKSYFHDVTVGCYDEKLRNRHCKMKNQISISARIGIVLKIQA